MIKEEKISTDSIVENVVLDDESNSLSLGKKQDEVQKKDKKEKIQKIAASIIAFLPVFFSVMYFIFNVIYKNKCKEFYGVLLDCYNINDWSYRLVSVTVTVALGFLCIWLLKNINKSSTDKIEKIITCGLQGMILFLLNLIFATKIIGLPFLSNLLKKSNSIFEIVITVVICIILGIISWGFVILLNTPIEKLPKMKKSSMFFFISSIVFQLIYIVAVVCVCVSVSPKNITEYTVVKTNEDTQYLVIGDYNDNFVCKEFKVISVNKIDETKSEFENLQDIEISFDKNQFELISYDEIYKIGTVKFSKVSSS